MICQMKMGKCRVLFCSSLPYLLLHQTLALNFHYPISALFVVSFPAHTFYKSLSLFSASSLLHLSTSSPHIPLLLCLPFTSRPFDGLSGISVQEICIFKSWGKLKNRIKIYIVCGANAHSERERENSILSTGRIVQK